MTLFYLLTAIVSAGYLLLILLYLYGWIKTPANQGAPLTIKHQPLTIVSIIVPARNEEQNIENCLNAIHRQKYPENLFEVIVVDDHSTDRTAGLVREMNRSNLRIIGLQEGEAGKKQALSQGIKNAKGDLIITTDADCTMGENWLASVVAFYEEKKPKMIVGPVLLQGENSLQEILQGQEMTILTACACAAIRWNRPILCSGANLAYEKSAFLALNGFDDTKKTATGDDVFLMLKMQERFPGGIGYLGSLDAIVFTHPQRTSAQALKQRKRWASKTFLYGFSYVTGIAVLIFLTNFLILFSGIMSAINLKFVWIPAICFFAKFLVDLMLVYSASSFFGKKFNPVVFMIFSIVYPVYVSFTGLISPLTRYSWKGRTSGV